MQSVSAAFLAALRGPHTATVTVTAYRNGVRVGGTLEVLDGQVEQSSGALSAPRRTLSLTLAPAKGLWDALAPFGTTLYVRRGIRYVNGASESVPLGVFDVDEQTLDYGPDGALSLTAPDVWVRVQRARFEVPRTTVGPMLPAANTLAAEAIAPGAPGTTAYGSIGGDTAATSITQVWTVDRDDAITQLSRAAGAWVYADANGLVTSRSVPSLYQTPVWLIDAGQTGVLLSAERNRSRQRTYSVVVVSGGDTTGVVPFTPVVLADTDPASPTYVGGSFGRVPYFLSSPLITTTAQATAAGLAALRRVTGLAAQLSVESIVNPALEAGDVISVLLPSRSRDGAKVERHLIDGITTPLTTSGTQSISTRSTRPEGDVPDDSGGG